jgi:hypothetical protein
MYILMYDDDWVAACFRKTEDGERFYDSLPPELKSKLLPNVLQYRYPFYIVWSWDRTDDDIRKRDKSKDSILLSSADDVNAFAKSIIRDKNWESKFEDSLDAQYFYLGIYGRDGIAYDLQESLGIYPSKKYSQLCDHEHITGYDLSRIQCEGVRRYLIRGKKQERLRRFRHRLRKYHRYCKIVERIGRDKLSNELRKKYWRLCEWISNNDREHVEAKGWSF